MALLRSGGRHQRRPGYRGRPEVTGRLSKRCNARPDHTFGSKAIGDRRWRELLDTHDQLAHQLVERHRGSLVKTTGDGVLATFDGPGRAVHCALAFRLATTDACGSAYRGSRNTRQGYRRHCGPRSRSGHDEIRCKRSVSVARGHRSCGRHRLEIQRTRITRTQGSSRTLGFVRC